MTLDLNWGLLDDSDVEQDNYSEALTFWYALPVFLDYTLADANPLGILCWLTGLPTISLINTVWSTSFMSLPSAGLILNP
jgi:hypothetical protein